MQGQIARPTDPGFIAYADTPDELWYVDGGWIKPPKPDTPKGPQMDRVVQAYNAIRDARTVARHAWEEADAALDQDQRMLKVLMLDLLNQTGAKSIATEQGTVYRTEKIKPSAADWNVVYAWITEDPERFELLEKRLKPTFVKQFMDDNAGALPPGVNAHREFEVSVRRPNSTTNTSAEDTP